MHNALGVFTTYEGKNKNDKRLDTLLCKDKEKERNLRKNGKQQGMKLEKDDVSILD